MHIHSFTLQPASGPPGTPITATVVVSPDVQQPPMTLRLQAVVQQGSAQAQGEASFELVFPAPPGVEVRLVDQDNAGFEIDAAVTQGNTTTFAVRAPSA